MAPIPKRKTERAPPIDRLLKPAIGVGLALLAYQFFRGLSGEIPRIDVQDELMLRHVFFGESMDDENPTKKNYVVLCHEENDAHISSVFQEAHAQNLKLAEFRLLDCNHVLQDSNKSIAERFKLNLKQRPTMFVSGHAGPPKQIPLKHLKTGNMLVKALKNLLEPRAVKIEMTQDLRNKCLSQDHCALLLKGSKTVSGPLKQAMQNLVSDFPKVAVAAVDTSNLFVKHLEEYLPEYQSGVHRFVVFSKQTPPSSGGGGGAAAKDKEERLKTSIAPLTRSVNYSNMKGLIQDVISKKTAVTPIPMLPMLKTRTKKLEEEERAKRQRREAQQQRSKQSSEQQQPTTGSSYQENDGSAAGRRAERERRRAEHRKNNPDYQEKTPEEIQEMERKRRQRMEEEAARWNVAPEDVPEEGEPVTDEYLLDEEDEGEWVEDEEENASKDREEDDEDVLDLDA